MSPGKVNWKIASRPPIRMPFRKVENCNQVVKIGKELKFSLVNIAGNDIVQGNKKLILGTFVYISLIQSLKLLASLPKLIKEASHSIFSLSLAANEIQHASNASTLKELKAPFESKANCRC